MNGLQIHIEQDRKGFKPGETIFGTVTWGLNKPPKGLELSLFWRTEGKGTQDIGIAQTLRFDNVGSIGSQEFSIKAPNGPYSFSGKLISIIWALELACEKGEETTRTDLVISATGAEVICSDSISDPDTKNMPGGLLGRLAARHR